MIATSIVFLVLMYAQVGVIFAVFFLMRGIYRLDKQARQSSLGFRLIILPGVVALWPLLLKRWISRG